MIQEVMKKFHQVRQGKGELADLIADDCVFYSPVVYTPQEGKELTMMYLASAGNVFSQKDADPAKISKPFAYAKEVIGENTAVLEFETTIDGLYMNGIDMITANEEGKISEFKVMIRPLQAINAIHAQMRAQLEKMQNPSA
jgi:hypothetical protein